MRGRKIDVTPEHIAKLTQAVRIGATYELAAKYAGISKDTFDRWRKAMEKAPEGSPLAELRTRLHQAEAQVAVHWLALINAAADTDWKSAAWLLARRYPEAYGRSLVKMVPGSPEGEALQGQGLSLLVQQAQVIMLPSKSPSPEQWQKDVEALKSPTNGGEGGGHRG